MCVTVRAFLLGQTKVQEHNSILVGSHQGPPSQKKLFAIVGKVYGSVWEQGTYFVILSFQWFAAGSSWAKDVLLLNTGHLDTEGKK